MNISTKLFLLRDISDKSFESTHSHSGPVKKNFYRQVYKASEKKKSEDHKRIGQAMQHHNIPTSNLPQVHKIKIASKPILNKFMNLPKMQSTAKIILTPITLSPIKSNQSFDKTPPFVQVGPSYCFFPKKRLTLKKNIIRKEKKKFTISSWGSESNNILWTLPQAPLKHVPG